MFNGCKVLNLKVEFARNPLGIEAEQPKFSWVVESTQRLWKQTAYQILVSDNEKELMNETANVWDSGKVESNNLVNIKYEGKKLQSGKRYYWKVRVWDREDKASNYSETAFWEMGLLSQEDWKAEWIGLKEDESILPIFRRQFNLEKEVKTARAYICGLGHYELYLNGDKVGSNVLDTGWTNYKKTCLYSVYDITEMLRRGQNAFGVMLGNGMYNVTGGRYTKFKDSFGNLKFILQVKIEFIDGSSEYILSDKNWKISESPITFSCIYGGEDYDARKEQDGWSTPNFVEENSWRKVNVVNPPEGKLKAQINPPIKVMKTFRPISMSEPRPGVYVYDFGQNFSGWPKISVKGSSGCDVKLTPAELLDKDGMAYQRFTGAPHYYLYTLKGESLEEWIPRFTYYGFRYLQVEGAVPKEKQKSSSDNSKPIIKYIEGQMIYPEVEVAGQFECSYPLFNKIHEIINWAILSNMKSVLTDCPHREKLGWLEQTHLVGPGIMYNYDVHNIYLKILDDIKEAQCDNGLVPDIAPEYVLFGYHDGFRDSPEWGSASIIDPWYVYRKYGDVDILKENYEVMYRYLDYLTSRADRYVLRHGLGDWLDVGPTPPYVHNTPVPVTATAIYYYDVQIMKAVAELLGRYEDAEKYEKLGSNIKDSFNREFFDDQALRYATGSQTANAMALFTGLVDKKHEEKVLDNLVKDIRVRGNHTTAGDVGHPFVLRALAKYNRSDVVADMLKLTDSPSYGYQIENGATTLCEDWDGPNPEKPRGSQNHFMLGGAEEWFYNGLAGIETTEGKNSLDEIIIKPHFSKEIDWVKASHEHPYGQVKVGWRRLKEENKLKIEISIPANTTGTVYLPYINGGIDAEDGVIQTSIEKENYTIIKIGSGNYSFLV